MEEIIAQLGLLEEEAILLDASALHLAALDHPDLSLEPYVDTLGAITEQLVALGGDATSASERAGVLARVFAAEYGFAGDRDSYDDPANADLIRVMDRRRGLPVSLAILYVAAARRIGWDADALNTPGHVLVRIGSATEPLLVDPFNRWADGRRRPARRLARTDARARRDAHHRSPHADVEPQRAGPPAAEPGDPRRRRRRPGARWSCTAG